MKKPLVGRGYYLPFVLITFFFFLWGFARALLDILNPFFQETLHLSKTQASAVQFATYLAYFLMAVPAGAFIRRRGTRRGVVCGLALFAVGALGFSLGGYVHLTRAFGVFLLMLFVSGCGLATLEVAANPYVTLLGDADTAAGRLNRAQSFNGLGSICGVGLGGLYCFGGPAPDVALPYAVIGLVVLALAVLFARLRLPEVVCEARSAESANGGSLRRHRMFVFGLTALFCYEVAEISINSFFVNYAAETDLVGAASALLPHMRPKLLASLVLSVGLLLFMGGRFLGSWLMQYVRAERVLLACGAATTALTLLVVLDYPVVSFFASLLIFVFESVMFPTIFALSVSGLGSLTQRASAVLMMTPIGGAVGTVLMGLTADLGNMRVAFVVPFVAFGVVLAYAVALTRRLNHSAGR